MLKMIGIVMVVSATSIAGISMARQVRGYTSLLQQLVVALELMKGEIEYRKTPLPELMRVVSLSSGERLRPFFAAISNDLYAKNENTVYGIFRRNLEKVSVTVLPSSVRQILLNLASGLGKFQVEGQMRAIELAMVRMEELIEDSRVEQKGRVKSYCTLGVCSGLAIGIMLL